MQIKSIERGRVTNCLILFISLLNFEIGIQLILHPNNDPSKIIGFLTIFLMVFSKNNKITIEKYIPQKLKPYQVIYSPNKYS